MAITVGNLSMREGSNLKDRDDHTQHVKLGAARGWEQEKPELESCTEKGKPTKESVSICFCCIINHSKTQWLITILVSY